VGHIEYKPKQVWAKPVPRIAYFTINNPLAECHYYKFPDDFQVATKI
jgi:hypothetical protein